MDLAWALSWVVILHIDTLYYSKPFRTLNIIDECNREVSTIEIDTSLPAGEVIRTLEQLGENYWLPQAERSCVYVSQFANTHIPSDLYTRLIGFVLLLPSIDIYTKRS